MLQKQFTSVKEVKIADVIRSFPLAALQSDAKTMNPLSFSPEHPSEKNSSKMGDGYSNVHFRFQTSVFLPGNHKEMVVYKDVVCNTGSLDYLSKIPVPLYKN